MSFDERAKTMGFQTIDTAPRDGTEILVTAEGEPVYRMCWNQFGSNALVQAERGIWWGPNGGFTWSEKLGYGPTHWAPTSNALAGVALK